VRARKSATFTASGVRAQALPTGRNDPKGVPFEYEALKCAAIRPRSADRAAAAEAITWVERNTEVGKIRRRFGPAMSLVIEVILVSRKLALVITPAVAGAGWTCLSRI
jgi:hypothetical protein